MATQLETEKLTKSKTASCMLVEASAKMHLKILHAVKLSQKIRSDAVNTYYTQELMYLEETGKIPKDLMSVLSDPVGELSKPASIPAPLPS
jgi:hypothetical protein